MNKVVKFFVKIIIQLAWTGLSVLFLLNVQNDGVAEFLQMPETSVGFWNYVFVNAALKALITGLAVWGVVSVLLIPITFFSRLRFLAAIPLLASVGGAIYFSMKFWPTAVEVPHWGWLFLVIPLSAIVYVFVLLAFAALTVPCFAMLFADDLNHNVIFSDDFLALVVGAILCAAILAILAIIASIIAFFAKMIVVGILIAIVVGIILSMPVVYTVVVYIK